jgi:TRL (tRNA-associated locus)-like protein
MNMRTLCSLALCLGLFTGCVYMDVKTPLDTDLNRTTLGTKVGVSEAYSVAWLVAWGDAGTAAAAKQGGITEIEHADQETFVILFGLFYRERTVLYGN